MDKDELLELILLNIERLGIVMAKTKLEQFAIINCEKFIGVYDPSSVTPFVLAHELIHAKYGDKLRHCDNNILSCEENEQIKRQSFFCGKYIKNKAVMHLLFKFY